MSEDIEFTRQIDIFNPEDFENDSCTIIGTGAIGSATGLMLAKLGWKNFTLFDDDKIEPHNIPNQVYMKTQLGKKKTEALKEVIELFGDVIEIEPRDKLTKDSLIVSRVTIVATDNMAARKLAYNKAKEFSEILIDARMGGQVYRIYTVNLENPDECAFYEKTLYDDKGASEEPCTARSIIWNVFGIAAEIGSQLTKALTEKPYKLEIIRDYVNTILTSE